MFTITAELVVDGAVADSMNFETEAEYDSWLQGVKADAPNWDDHVPYEVYRVDHSCGGAADCVCAQYILAHVPEWSRPYVDRVREQMVRYDAFGEPPTASCVCTCQPNWNWMCKLHGMND